VRPTSPDLQRPLAAAARLRAAILATRASDNWHADEAAIIYLVQLSIARWAYDLAQTFRELAEL